MVVMYHFVFWFSTRFGSLVVSIFTLVNIMQINKNRELHVITSSISFVILNVYTSPHF